MIKTIKTTDPVTDPVEQPKEELTATEKKEVRVIERIIENREITPADTFGKMTRAQIELVKRTVAKGATDDELRLFIQVCKGAQLNPFLRQVHLVPFWDSKEGIERKTILVGIDGFRSVAESSGKYAGNDDPIYDGEQDVKYMAFENRKQVEKTIKVPVKATVTVYKIVEGGRYGFTATARWDEYYPGERKGFQWHLRPYLMLGKCAEALALRKAFPKLLSGMYAAEEMDRTVQVDDEAQKSKKAHDYVKNVIATADIKELKVTKALIEKSDKYTDEQKSEFLTLVDKRIQELDVPTIEQ